MSPPPSWSVERVTGRAGELHEQAASALAGPALAGPALAGSARAASAPAGSARAASAPAGSALAGSGLRRQVRLVEASHRAVVLGSTQPAGHLDDAAVRAAGLDVARRRSGGSAVLVGPGECLWIDVVVPAGDPLWDADVGRAAWWVGEVWCAAIAEVTGRDDLAVWRGGLRRSPWSDRVCFAGVGPGEVTLAGALPAGEGPGPKVVGVSQRRTRAGSLFQTAALLRWEPAEVAALLAGDDAWRQAATAGLDAAAVGLGPHLAEPLGDAFVRLLHHAAT